MIPVLLPELYQHKGVLDEHEYLLKTSYDTGYMTKLNKDGTVPLSFKGWGNSGVRTKVERFVEEFRNGWEFGGYRHGKSVSWIRVKHPLGFYVEIRASDLVTLLCKCVVAEGIIQDRCYYDAKRSVLLVEDHEISRI